MALKIRKNQKDRRIYQEIVAYTLEDSKERPSRKGEHPPLRETQSGKSAVQ